MAEQQQEFGYRNIVLYKSQTLGAGSYGGVCKAKCDGLLCAAKIMHPTLFDLRDPGATSYLRRFEEECHLLSLARHPNIVQYLATYCDPETHLPVLLMELCDESLCRFLERSVQQLPFHTELNISHDIALALVYLHNNGLIHRDLTGNNVLMIAGVRAKITDFGMSKLANVNPRMTPLTFCPGNIQYMSPEALEEPPSYSDKLDIFSFGVLLVQIMTRQFPNPGPRFQVDPQYLDDNVRVMVPATQRRSGHLQLICSTHPLKSIALNCLNSKETARPSAHKLSNTLSELKLTPHYAQSMHMVQSNIQELSSLQKQVKDLQQHRQELQQKNELKEQQIQEQKILIDTARRDFQELHSTVKEMERERQQKIQTIQTREREMQASKQLVAQLQQKLEQNDKTIRDLHQTVVALKRNTLQSEQHPQQLPVTADAPPVATTSLPHMNLRWKEGRTAPERMHRGAAVVDRNIIYINPNGSSHVYSCHVFPGEEQWSTFLDTHRKYFSLVVIDGLLTSVGGVRTWYPTNSLRSLNQTRQWSEIFPSIPTARIHCTAVCTRRAVIVAGGNNGRSNIDTVEVMNTDTKQWIIARHLPQAFRSLSGTICGENIYLAGGVGEVDATSKSVLTCSLTDLLPLQSLGARMRSLSLVRKQVWFQVMDLPVIQSTLTTLDGHLLAIGGADDSKNPTADVYCYEDVTDSWHVVGKMTSKLYECLAAVLPDNQLVIVGGWKSNQESDSVETAYASFAV